MISTGKSITLNSNFLNQPFIQTDKISHLLSEKKKISWQVMIDNMQLVSIYFQFSWQTWSYKDEINTNPKIGSYFVHRIHHSNNFFRSSLNHFLYIFHCHLLSCSSLCIFYDNYWYNSYSCSLSIQHNASSDIFRFYKNSPPRKHQGKNEHNEVFRYHRTWDRDSWRSQETRGKNSF